ncbi:MAG: ATP-binding cassette domain-containing protein [Clostridia bacterium]|nr:ATP-binding cassette domain-containing protein [Clostridia bacterium]
MCEDCVLEAREISKSFKKKQVLHDVNIKIRKGEIYGLVGNNGAGKTTLLKIMFGILAPNEGKIYAAKEGLSTGALISKPNLYKDMSAFENLKAMAIAIGYKCEDKELYDLLELVGLSETGKKMAGRFSTGMKQRLGIALAIVGNPDVLILDEPISGLDIEGIVDTRKILLKLNKERGTTIIISSHILDELSKITTRICLMKKGKIIYEDTMENFMKKGNGKSAEESYIEILSENVSA